jgi:hypothetical protein
LDPTNRFLLTHIFTSLMCQPYVVLTPLQVPSGAPPWILLSCITFSFVHSFFSHSHWCAMLSALFLLCPLSVLCDHHLYIMSDEDVFNQSAEAVSKECERIIEEYRQGGVRQVAIMSLAETLSTVGDFRPLATYLSMLDEHDHKPGEVRAQGETCMQNEGAEVLAALSRDCRANEERVGQDQRPNGATVTTG